MAANITLFAQAIATLPKKIIKGIISKCNSDKFCKGFDTWSQLVSMIFCQFANSTSVRDISNGLKSATGNLNHLGIREAPSKSTVAYQNRHRGSSVFREIYYACLEHLGQHTFGKRKKFKFKNPVKLLDSTLISLCLSVFDWAHYKTHKGAVKMHALLDYDMLLPHYVLITDGKKGDNTAAKQIPVERGTVVVSDRYCCDFELLNHWDSNGVFFVVRHKSNLSFRKVRENDLPPVRHQNVLIDEIVELTSPQTIGKYPTVAARGRLQRGEGVHRRVAHQQLQLGGKHHRRTLQVKMAGRDFLHARETAAAHQKLCRHVAERGGDTAVDGPDHHTDAQISPVQGIIRLESV